LRKRNNFKNKELIFGQYGIKILQPFQLTSKQIFRFKLLLKKSSKRADKTKRFFWIKTFNNYPLTQKSQGLRMGKGKGKLKIWVGKINAGSLLFETKNLRYGRAIYFLKQIKFRLKSFSKIIYKSFEQIPFPLKKNNFFFFKSNL